MAFLPTKCLCFTMVGRLYIPHFLVARLCTRLSTRGSSPIVLYLSSHRHNGDTISFLPNLPHRPCVLTLLQFLLHPLLLPSRRRHSHITTSRRSHAHPHGAFISSPKIPRGRLQALTAHSSVQQLGTRAMQLDAHLQRRKHDAE